MFGRDGKSDVIPTMFVMFPHLVHMNSSELSVTREQMITSFEKTDD